VAVGDQYWIARPRNPIRVRPGQRRTDPPGTWVGADGQHWYALDPPPSRPALPAAANDQARSVSADSPTPPIDQED
jgi:hypothetical protein